MRRIGQRLPLATDSQIGGRTLDAPPNRCYERGMNSLEDRKVKFRTNDSDGQTTLDIAFHNPAMEDYVRRMCPQLEQDLNARQQQGDDPADLFGVICDGKGILEGLACAGCVTRGKAWGMFEALEEEGFTSEELAPLRALFAPTPGVLPIAIFYEGRAAVAQIRYLALDARPGARAQEAAS